MKIIWFEVSHIDKRYTRKNILKTTILPLSYETAFAIQMKFYL